jgi:hypothetical protein
MKKLIAFILGSAIGLFTFRVQASLPRSDIPDQPAGPTIQTLIESGLIRANPATGAYDVDVKQLELCYGTSYLQILRGLAKADSHVHFTDLDDMQLAGQEGMPEQF